MTVAAWVLRTLLGRWCFAASGCPSLPDSTARLGQLRHRGQWSEVGLPDPEPGRSRRPIVTRQRFPCSGRIHGRFRAGRRVDQWLNQIWVGQMAPVIIPKAGWSAGVVGLFQFCTWGWAPIDHTVRAVHT